MQSIAPSSALNIEFKNKAGTSQVVGDLTSLDGVFIVSPSVITIGEREFGQKFEIYSISVDMRLDAVIDVVKYGIGGALTTGITITCSPAFDPVNFKPVVIKTNEDLEKYFSKESKLSDKTFMGKFRLFMDVGSPIILRAKVGKPRDELIVTGVEDMTVHFTGCTNSFMAHGKWETI